MRDAVCAARWWAVVGCCVLNASLAWSGVLGGGGRLRLYSCLGCLATLPIIEFRVLCEPVWVFLTGCRCALVCGNFTASLSALGCPPRHIPHVLQPSYPCSSRGSATAVCKSWPRVPSRTPPSCSQRRWRPTTLWTTCTFLHKVLPQMRCAESFFRRSGVEGEGGVWSP